ncbi:MAG: PH domain-containing protein [Cellulomonas sp.]|nr:PH domain-containing protein [Cellulomonas sp.]
MPTSDEVWTYRPRSAIPATAGVWLLAVGMTAAQGATGGTAGVLRALPFALAGALAGWLVFYRPFVRVSDEGVHVVNPLRTYEVPWEALVDIRTRYTCTLVTPHRAIEVFAAPGPGRQVAAAATVTDLRRPGGGSRDKHRPLDVGELPRTASGAVATMVRRRWQELVESDRLEPGLADVVEIPRTTDVRAVIALAGLLALGVLLAVAT